MALLYYMLCQLRGSKANWYAGMAELADAHGTGPCDYCSHEGSSPFSCILINDAAEQLNTQEWRNWQTRTVQVRVTIAVMRVQVPFPASLKSAEYICWFLRYNYYGDIKFCILACLFSVSYRINSPASTIILSIHEMNKV